MEISSFNILTALIIAAAVIHYSKPSLADDVGTNFFLKASKSVPRIGRRSMDYENYFLKASKSVPRIGRRRTLSPMPGAEPAFLWNRPVKGYPKEKKSFPDRYFAETGQPIWSNIEKAYEDYPGMFQSDEPYREIAANDADADAYWRKLKNDEDLRTQSE